MKYMGIDPGMTTGMAWFLGAVDAVGNRTNAGWAQVIEPGGMVRSAEVVAGIVIQQEPDVLGIEKFRLRGPNVKSTKDDALSACRMESMIEVWLDVMEYPGKVMWAMAVQAKTVFTDQRLKDRGLWIPGKPHACDAMRHALLAERRNG